MKNKVKDIEIIEEKKISAKDITNFAVNVIGVVVFIVKLYNSYNKKGR